MATDMPQIGLPHVPDDTPSMQEQNDALLTNAIARQERRIAELEAELWWRRKLLAEIRRIKP